MIIVKLKGGLGNQMFQYAMGKNLSIKNNTSLELDISNFKKEAREYSLNIFNIKVKIKKNRASIIFKKILSKAVGKKLLEIKESGLNFDERILKLKDNTCLNGYWQSEKYFLENKKIIKENFNLKKKYKESINKNLFKKIEGTSSVSIHVRRGDYVNNVKINQIHGSCSIDYYNRAIESIKEGINTPTFFIFSDDIDWCKKNLIIDSPAEFMEGNKDYEDLILMSKCKHNIIANSSFSWWAAWLNKNKNKIVIAPKNWFNDKDINTKDIIPESWIKI